MIMNFIKKLFIQNNNPTPVSSSAIVDNDNSISVIIDDIGRVRIKLHIKSPSATEAKNFAQMLHNLQSSLYQQTIVELLIDLAQQSESLKEFSKTVVENWHNKLLITKVNDSPIISPSHFSNHTAQ